jgi:hypothetical protein
MRVLFAGAALAALVAGCAPESDKTNPAVATDDAAAERAAAAPATGANSFTQEQARERATNAGYMDVGALTQAADGTWQGAAMKDGASVTVVVDYQGNVTTQGGVTPAAPDGAMPPASTPPVTVPPAAPSPAGTPAPTTPQ